MHFLMFSTVVLPLLHMTTHAANLPTVTISAGAVQGTTCPNSKASEFLSIPFAQPPIGNLRFASPIKPGAFSGASLNATTLPPACLQYTAPNGLGTIPGGGQEDCLYLNVWAPLNASKESKLPVKVWIYGGAELAGGTQDPLYDGCNVAARDAIFVSVAYRLGPLGFLALETAGIKGNFAIEDILLGLQWVQDNIVAFGGDPKKVLLHGESAGARNTFAISTLPVASTLMKAVVLESGDAPTALNASTAQSLGVDFAKGLNCSVKDTNCFKAASATALYAAYTSSLGPSSQGSSSTGTINLQAAAIGKFGPYVDGKVIPVNPDVAGTRIPAIFGTNAQEGTILLAGIVPGGLNAINETYFNNIVETTFPGKAAAAIHDQYSLSQYPSQYAPFFALSAIVTDYALKCPTYRNLMRATEKGVPAWAYLSNHTLSCPWVSVIKNESEAEILGPTHTSEIPLVFGNLDNLPLPNGTCNLNLAESDISDYLMSAWTSMADRGNPNANNGGMNSPEWPVFDYEPAKSPGILIQDDGVAVASINYTSCQIWNTLYAESLGNSTNGTTVDGNSSGNAASSPSPLAAPSQAAGASALSFEKQNALFAVAAAMAVYAML